MRRESTSLNHSYLLVLLGSPSVVSRTFVPSREEWTYLGCLLLVWEAENTAPLCSVGWGM